ncbi:MAG: thioredoxin family protein [Anaerolineae bacterium]|nr:thioredoxin family protein [Anaerolineae bacterium]
MSERTGTVSNLKIGDSALDFELRGVDGLLHRLADYADKPALAVIFTCNHCPYVLAWEDRLMALQNEFAWQGFQIVTINANDAIKYPTDDFASMQKHAQEKAFPYPYLHDESQAVARAYGAERTPEIFLFDATRSLRYHGAPDDNYDDPSAVRMPYLRQAVEALLAGSSPEIAQTPPVGCTVKWK